MLYIKEKDSDIWGPLQSRPRHNQSPANIIRTKETVVKVNKSALTVISGITRHRQGNNSIDDLVRFVKRKIAKYNNYISWQGPGVLLQTGYHASAGAYSTRFPLIKITPHHL